MPRGRLITLEGGEGAGKSTQCARLAAWLEGQGLKVVQTREPGGTPEAEAIRRLLLGEGALRWDAMSEALLLFAARRAHVSGLIAPALARGAWVVCDRFTDSTMAYQGYALGLGREMVERLAAIALGDLHPDLTLILDVPVAEGLARAAARRDGDHRFERMDEGFHQALRDAFQDIARREPGRCAVIDAAGSVDAVAQAIEGEVRRRLALHAA